VTEGSRSGDVRHGGAEGRARLSVVATPIGNLADLTERARLTLADADRILCEDTRRTRALLSHLGIAKKTVERMDAKVEAASVARVLSCLERGEHVVLVSDAGTPGVSDPGARLARAAAQAGIAVTPIPGPSAVMAALAASGFPGARFRFFGFLPRSGGRRREVIAEIAASPETVVIFESAERIAATIADLAAIMPAREAVLGREMTKVHEEFVHAPLGLLAARVKERGEMVLVLGPAVIAERALSEDELDRRIDELLARGLRAREIARVLAPEAQQPARVLYARVSLRKDAAAR
jgi:16S rRNA (cytidine1402-2'-O)-methyltransferase